MSSPSWTSFSPHPTPLGCHRAVGLSSLCHTANTHQLSILHMVIYVSMLISVFVPPSPSPGWGGSSYYWVRVEVHALHLVFTNSPLVGWGRKVLLPLGTWHRGWGWFLFLSRGCENPGKEWVGGIPFYCRAGLEFWSHLPQCSYSHHVGVALCINQGSPEEKHQSHVCVSIWGGLL